MKYEYKTQMGPDWFECDHEGEEIAAEILRTGVMPHWFAESQPLSEYFRCAQSAARKPMSFRVSDSYHRFTCAIIGEQP